MNIAYPCFVSKASCAASSASSRSRSAFDTPWPSTATSSTSGKSVTTVDTNEIPGIGERVICVHGTFDKHYGYLRYIGTVENQTDDWCGIEFDDPIGKHNGSYYGKKYFECEDNHGIFVRPVYVKQVI